MNQSTFYDTLKSFHNIFTASDRLRHPPLDITCSIPLNFLVFGTWPDNFLILFALFDFLIVVSILLLIGRQLHETSALYSVAGHGFWIGRYPYLFELGLLMKNGFWLASSSAATIFVLLWFIFWIVQHIYEVLQYFLILLNFFPVLLRSP